MHAPAQVMSVTVSCLVMKAHLRHGHSYADASLLVHLLLLTFLGELASCLGTGLLDVTVTFLDVSLLRVEVWEVPALMLGELGGGFAGSSLAAWCMKSEALVDGLYGRPPPAELDFFKVFCITYSVSVTAFSTLCKIQAQT